MCCFIGCTIKDLDVGIKSGGESLILVVRKWVSKCGFVMVFVREWGFDAIGHKCENPKNEGVWNYFLGFVRVSWWFYGGGVM